MASFHRRAPRGLGVGAQRGRTPATLLAAIETPVPVQHHTTPRRRRPSATASPTASADVGPAAFPVAAVDDVVAGGAAVLLDDRRHGVTSSVPTAMRTGTSSGASASGRRRGPALGVVLDQLLDDRAVDGVDEHEAAPLGRILGRVAQHAPRRPAAQAPPHLLGRGVPDGEADGLLGRRAPRSRRRASASST